jgi:hypothetical protein
MAEQVRERVGIGNLQRQVDAALKLGSAESPPALDAMRVEEGAPQPSRRFSAFHLPDVQRAKELAAEWMDVAEEVRGSGEDPAAMRVAVGAALEEATGVIAEMEAATELDANLARHAVKLFLTHYKHELPLRIHALEAREPWLVLPSRNGDGPPAVANPEEALLWFREDPKLNEHHEHWHVVYPISGVPAPGNPRGGEPKERQGELFLYMHRQMMARYDTERLAVGLGRVEPWSYFDTDPYGYDPGPYLRTTYGPRPPGKKWETTPEAEPNKPSTIMVAPKEMAKRGQRLFAAAASGVFELPNGEQIPVDADLLGMTQEADIGTVESGVIPWDPKEGLESFDKWYVALVSGYYGNFHNVGHDMFGWLSTNNNGVMGFVPTAMRDHVFYRWHKLIDNLYATWQDTQPSHDFAADAPNVTIRKHLPGKPEVPDQSPDIILCLQRDLVPWDDWQKFGEAAFGGAQNWDKEFASGSFKSPEMPTPYQTTGQLATSMRQRVITIETGAEPPAQPGEKPHAIEYLDQEEFFYFFRLQNETSEAQDVTVRVFIVAADDPEWPEDRRMWIEMDKFKQSLAAEEQAVVFRPASLSSVIRKPGTKPPSAEQPPIRAKNDFMQEDAKILENYCDCGWPYNLLLPRGTKQGMRFRLLVMLTDWSIDNVPQEGDCGSMSYCGALEKYPDARPMGYPFDAPFTDKTIAETIAESPNMATRDIEIHWS